MLSDAIDEFFPTESFGNLQIIAEPGRYFAATTFTLAVNVIAKRNLGEQEAMIYVNDGVYGNMNCILFDHQEPTPRTLYHNKQFHYYDFDSSSTKKLPLYHTKFQCGAHMRRSGLHYKRALHETRFGYGRLDLFPQFRSLHFISRNTFQWIRTDCRHYLHRIFLLNHMIALCLPLYTIFFSPTLLAS